MTSSFSVQAVNIIISSTLIMKTSGVLLFVCMVGYCCASEKWEKLSPTKYDDAEQTIKKSPVIFTVLEDYNQDCVQALWKIGNGYTQQITEVASDRLALPLPGRMYMMEILCPYTETERYSLYLGWISTLQDETLVPLTSSVFVYDSLDEIPNEDVVRLLAGENLIKDLINAMIDQLYPFIEGLLCYTSKSCSQEMEGTVPGI